MAISFHVSEFLPLKNSGKEERLFSVRKFDLKLIVSRNDSGIYSLFVYDKDRKGLDRKRYGSDNLKTEQDVIFTWNNFLEEFSNIFE